MRFDLDNLPSEPTHLQHLIRDMAAVVEHRDGKIERLKSIIKKLQRAQFGRRSERLDPDQLALDRPSARRRLRTCVDFVSETASDFLA
jgi:transposase